MGQLRPKYAPIRTRSARPRPRLVWPEPKKGKTTLSVTRQGSLWGPELSLVDTCREEEPRIPSANTAAIALLRSLRNVSEEEAQRQRESWELLKQDLDENKYH